MIVNRQILLELQCQLETLITEREGMIAENSQRKITGNSMAYCEDAFMDIVKRMRSVQDIIITLGER